jgi:polysaccharide export outer membrane protein
MGIFSTSNVRRWSALAPVLLLCACSTNNTSYLLSGKNGSSDSNGAVTPVVLPITEELVRSQKTQREQQAGQDLKTLVGVPKPYVIGPGDILSIVVWGHPELVAAAMAVELPTVGGTQLGSGAGQEPAGFVVDHDGMLQYPYAGVLNLSGLTEVEARNLLSSKIAQYINKPNVTLRVQAYRSKRIYVAGEVKTPGLLAINDIPMTLVEALNRAGGVLPTGDQSQISVTRDGVVYEINLPKIVQKGVDPASLLLKHGDVVHVLSRDESKVFITGEVTTPKSLTMHDGRLTLNEALGESGGINPLSGDARQVFVVRKSDKQPLVYQLDAESPGALAMAESFELNPKDLVYVAPTTLTDWHRTISQILPGELSAAIGAGKQP